MREHKTSRNVKQKRMILPVVAPLVSVSDAAWADAWLDARCQLGLANEGDLDFPFTCRFMENGEPTQQEITATEMGKMLRAVLKIPEDARNEIRSHSLKSTMLSWCAKYGIHTEVRRRLGHHVDPAAKSTEIYARDTLAPCLREMTKVVHEVRCGLFDPDATRSGRFRAPMGSQARADSNDSGDSKDENPSSTSTDSSSDAGPEQPDEPLPDNSSMQEFVDPTLRAVSVPCPEGMATFRHVVSGVHHFAQAQGPKFLCGRVG